MDKDGKHETEAGNKGRRWKIMNRDGKYWIETGNHSDEKLGRKQNKKKSIGKFLDREKDCEGEIC